MEREAESGGGPEARELVENGVWLAVYAYALACLLVWTLSAGVLALAEHGVRAALSALQQGSPLLWAHLGAHMVHYGTAFMLALLPHETRQALHSLNAFSVVYVWGAAALAWWDLELVVAMHRETLQATARHRVATAQTDTGPRTPGGLWLSLARRLWDADEAAQALTYTQNDTLRRMLPTLHGRCAVLVLVAVQRAGRHYRSLSAARGAWLLARIATTSSALVYTVVYLLYDLHLSQLLWDDSAHSATA